MRTRDNDPVISLHLSESFLILGDVNGELHRIEVLFVKQHAIRWTSLWKGVGHAFSRFWGGDCQSWQRKKRRRWKRTGCGSRWWWRGSDGCCWRGFEVGNILPGYPSLSCIQGFRLGRQGWHLQNFQVWFPGMYCVTAMNIFSGDETGKIFIHDYLMLEDSANWKSQTNEDLFKIWMSKLVP